VLSLLSQKRNKRANKQDLENRRVGQPSSQSVSNRANRPRGFFQKWQTAGRYAAGFSCIALIFRTQDLSIGGIEIAQLKEWKLS